MGQTKRNTLPSKGEVAFRFVACTTIALALYYTPELKWSSDAPDTPALQIDAMLGGPAREPSLDACATIKGRGSLINVAMGAN